MTETTEQNKAALPQWEGDTPGRVDAVAVAVGGIILAILVVVVVLGGQAWYYYEQEKHFQENVYTQPDRALREYQAEQTEQLQTYRRHRDGTAAIPIDQAMKLYVQQNKQP